MTVVVLSKASRRFEPSHSSNKDLADKLILWCNTAQLLLTSDTHYCTSKCLCTFVRGLSCLLSAVWCDNLSGCSFFFFYHALAGYSNSSSSAVGAASLPAEPFAPVWPRALRPTPQKSRLWSVLTTQGPTAHCLQTPDSANQNCQLSALWLVAAGWAVGLCSGALNSVVPSSPLFRSVYQPSASPGRLGAAPGAGSPSWRCQGHHVHTFGQSGSVQASYPDAWHFQKHDRLTWWFLLACAANGLQDIGHLVGLLQQVQGWTGHGQQGGAMRRNKTNTNIQTVSRQEIWKRTRRRGRSNGSTVARPWETC